MMQFPIPTFKTRRALIVIDLQNEFVSETGQCRVLQPVLVDNIINLITEFRKEGGEVIWTRTEYKQHRKLTDVRIMLAEDDSLYTSRDQIEADVEGKPPTVPTTIKKDHEEQGGNKVEKKDPEGADPDSSQELLKLAAEDSAMEGVSSDAILSIRNPILCGKDSPGSAFIPALTSEVKRRNDRVITKSWYSAFCETNLLMNLQGRLVTEVYICGALTNTSVFATALDAVQNGFKVIIPSDCCGFRNISAHQAAVAEMTGRLGVESMLSRILIRMWNTQRSNGNEASTTVRTVDTNQLKTVVENAIRAGEGGVQLPDPSDSDVGTDDLEDRREKAKGMSVLPNPKSTSAMDLSDCKDNVCAHFNAYIFLCNLRTHY